MTQRVPAAIGVNLGHDAGVALVTPGEVRVVEMERAVGRKHVCGGSADVQQAVRRAVEAWIADPALDVRAVALADYHSPQARTFPPGARAFAAGAEWHAAGRAAGADVLVRALPPEDGFAEIGVGPGGPPAFLVRHHWAHAAAAFGTSPFGRALVLCLDGTACFGESGLVALARDGEMECVQRFANLEGPRFGLLYEAFARRAFGGQFDTGKLLGLAACGTPVPALVPVFRGLLAGSRFRAAQPDLLAPLPEEALRGSRIRYGEHWFPWNAAAGGYLEGRLRGHEDAVQVFGAWFPDAVEVGGARLELCFDPARRECQDAAATLQSVFETELLSLAAGLRARYPAYPDLCFAGGCALNITANTRLVREGGFGRVHIPSCCNDSGIALGAALAVFGQDHAAWRADGEMRVALAGPACGELDRLESLAGDGGGLELRFVDEDEMIAAAARLLAQGRVLAWVQGGCETGPRALGHRSLFASPLHAGMRARVSERIKGREWFRPIAPICREEDLPAYFDGPLAASPAMLYAFHVRPEHAASLAEVRHVDGTARVQTVRAGDNPLVHRLLHRVGEETGTPVLINTSLNGPGRPIANAASEVLDLLRATELDGVVFADRRALCLKAA